MNLHLVVTPRDETAVLAGYSCPCGCQPRVSYEHGGPEATDACCCGNHFAVGPRATASLESKPRDRLEVQTFLAPWGEELQAAWALLDDAGHGHDHDHEHDHGPAMGQDPEASVAGAAIDPVCGMTVDPPAAREKGLHSRYREADYYFCGKGCKLEFDEDPERYLDPNFVPSM